MGEKGSPNLLPRHVRNGKDTHQSKAYTEGGNGKLPLRLPAQDRGGNKGASLLPRHVRNGNDTHQSKAYTEGGIGKPPLSSPAQDREGIKA
ncbi:Protein of unknown function [Gryllus bimaculatus]|nr:Protein of unknown function [Gryllus bimaculatus]